MIQYKKCLVSLKKFYIKENLLLLCRFMAAEWRTKRKFLSHLSPADLISPCDFFKGFAFKNAHGQKNLFHSLP